MAEHRWFKFWPQDWQRDPALRSCGIAARGLWMDLLCIMHDGAPYGHLTIAGKPATAKQIGTITGVGERDAMKLLAELEESGVFSRTEDGVIFSRRMVRDKAARDVGRENGITGGNPALKGTNKAKVNGSGGGGVNPSLYPEGGEGAQTLDTDIKKQNLEAEEREEPLHTPNLPQDQRVGARARECVKDEFEEFWCNYPRKVGKGAARKAYLAAIAKESHATILAKLQRYKWPAREQFIPHPATWLNSERWLDEQEQFDPVLRAMGIKPEDFDDETQGNAWKALLQ